MQITLDIPDELAAQISVGNKDLSRTALEALAAEGYRAELLSESEIRQMLGFETRMEVHAFLKEHSAFLHYSQTDLEQDRKSAHSLRAKRKSSLVPAEHQTN